jgi:hypothetical protein
MPKPAMAPAITSVGDAIRGITLLASVLDIGDVENWIEWIQ